MGRMGHDLGQKTVVDAHKLARSRSYRALSQLFLDTSKRIQSITQSHQSDEDLGHYG